MSLAPGTDPPISSLTAAAVAARLDPLPLQAPHCRDGQRAAAVLLALRDGGLGPELLLVRRAAHLDEHPGQIALPGGRMDPGDGHPAATALREAREEVGLEPEQALLLGALTPLAVPVSRHLVMPVVAWLAPGSEAGVGSAETAEAWFTPLARLLEAAHPALLRGRPGWEYRLPGARVWGMTALVLEEFLARLGLLPAAGSSQGRAGR